MKRQLKRLSAAYPGLYVSLTREGNCYSSGEYQFKWCAYRGTTDPESNGRLADGATASSAVDNLIEADRSTSAGQEASSKS